MPPNKPVLKYLIGIIIAAIIILLIVNNSRNNTSKSTASSLLLGSSINTNYLTKSMLEEMNTDIGIKSIELDYCSGGCSLVSDEKNIYECEYQDYLDSDWSECSQSCGDTGVRTRTKRVLFDFGNNCADNPAPIETEACNRVPCPIDCVVGEWGAWTDCSAPCGDGVKSRTRPVITPAQYGGAVCPPTEENNVPCNEGPCCITADWSSPEEGWTGDGCSQTRTVKKVVSSYYPDFTGCPVADIALDTRNICDISLQQGILKEGEVYTYNEVTNMLGSQTDIIIPGNTKLIVTLQDNTKYVVGALPNIFSYKAEIQTSNNESKTIELGKATKDMTIKAIQLLTTSLANNGGSIYLLITRDGNAVFYKSFEVSSPVSLDNFRSSIFETRFNVLKGDSINIKVGTLLTGHFINISNPTAILSI